MIFSIFLTGSTLSASHLSTTGERIDQSKKLQPAQRVTRSSANLEQKNLIQTTNASSSSITHAASASPEIIENALNLAHSTYHFDTRSMSQSFAQTEFKTKIESIQQKRIEQITNAIENYEKLSDLNKKHQNYVNFTQEVNKTFNKLYTFNANIANIFADFISDIFATMVKPHIYAHFYSSTPELFLQNNLEKLLSQQSLTIDALLHCLLRTEEYLTKYKIQFFNNSNNNLNLKYFDKNLPIDTWIQLTEKLYNDIDAIISKSAQSNLQEEEKESTKPTQPIKTIEKKESATIEPKEKTETNNPSSDTSSKIIFKQQLQSLIDEQEKALQNLKAEQKKEFKSIKELKKDESEKMYIQNRFEYLEQLLEKREKEIALPKELKNLNNILDAIHILLLKKEPNDQLNEIFEFLLNEFYSKFIESKDFVKNMLFNKKLMINLKFDNPIFYKPLYDIIILKLNILLSLYAIKNNMDFNKTIKIHFTPNTPKNEKYIFTPTIQQLQNYNNNAEIYQKGTLEKLAHPKTLDKIKDKTTEKTSGILETIGNTISNAASATAYYFSRPFVWSFKTVNSLFSESKEQQKEKEAYNKKQQEEKEAYNKKINDLLEALLSSNQPLISSTPSLSTSSSTKAETSKVDAVSASAAASGEIITIEPEEKINKSSNTSSATTTVDYLSKQDTKGLKKIYKPNIDLKK